MFGAGYCCFSCGCCVGLAVPFFLHFTLFVLKFTFAVGIVTVAQVAKNETVGSGMVQ